MNRFMDLCMCVSGNRKCWLADRSSHAVAAVPRDDGIREEEIELFRIVGLDSARKEVVEAVECPGVRSLRFHLYSNSRFLADCVECEAVFKI